MTFAKDSPTFRISKVVAIKTYSWSADSPTFRISKVVAIKTYSWSAYITIMHCWLFTIFTTYSTQSNKK